MNRISWSFAWLALTASSSFGYIRLNFRQPGGAVIHLSRGDAAGIRYYVNDQIRGGQISTATGTTVNVVTAGSDPVGAIRAALATWSSVPGSQVRFLPLQSTSAGHNASDSQMTVTFASADDLSVLGYSPGVSTGAIAITTNSWSTDSGILLDSDILLNPSLTFSTDGSTGYDVQSVFTHELGHALGANHSGLLGATMFPYSTVGGVAVLSQRLLSSDDMAFASAVYPVNPAAMGTLGGRVIAGDSSPVKAALLTLIDRATGNTIGSLTGLDGSWSVRVPPGSYMMYAEPFNSIVGASSILSLDPGQVTTGFQTTVLGTSASPVELSVSANASVNAPDLVVSSGGSALALPFTGRGSVGGNGDIHSVLTPTGPLVLASGDSLDIGFVGGLDAGTTVQVFGQGISVRNGSTRVDTGISFGALGPLVRSTLDIAPRQTPALASFLITKGSSTLALSGYLVLVPAKPVFQSQGVVSSASFTGNGAGDGAVSPGGIYSIFGLQGQPTLGPPSGVQPTAYDDYGNLASLLAGDSVTFDNIPGPMFYASDGQINVQAPFEVADRASVLVKVTYMGSTSDAVRVPVLPSQPAFFGYNGGASTIVVNKDNAFNTQSNPVARGDYVTFYGTGIGTASGYPVLTGRAAPAPPPGYSGNTSCTLNGSKTVPVAFAGWTPTTVGLAQWTVILPSDSPTGKVTVKCTDPHGAETPAGFLYIK